MPSERVQRQIDALLNEAEAAIKGLDWALVRQRCEAVLRLGKGNADALAYLDATGPDGKGEALAQPGSAAKSVQANASPLQPSTASHPASLANGRYTVKRFLGEGGKKKVYLAHDSVLDRDVAFALIKTEGLDDTANFHPRREGDED